MLENNNNFTDQHAGSQHDQQHESAKGQTQEQSSSDKATPAEGEKKKGNTSNRGFASMSREKQRRIASKGGQIAHERGVAHQFTSAEAREAGKKGGAIISRNREHMAAIGKKGGEVSRSSRKNAQKQQNTPPPATDNGNNSQEEQA